MCACATEHRRCSEIERGSWFFLPFHRRRPGDQTQVGLGCKHLYLLVHLPCPLMSLKSYHWGIISALWIPVIQYCLGDNDQRKYVYDPFHLKLTEFMDAEPDLERTILFHFSKSTLFGISTVTGRVEALLQFLCFLLCPLYQEGYTSGEVRGALD